MSCDCLFQSLSVVDLKKDEEIPRLVLLVARECLPYLIILSVHYSSSSSLYFVQYYMPDIYSVIQHSLIGNTLTLNTLRTLSTPKILDSPNSLGDLRLLITYLGISNNT